MSPLEAWLGNAQFIDCFGESVSREKLESADIIGVRRRRGKGGGERDERMFNCNDRPSLFYSSTSLLTGVLLVGGSCQS